MGVGTQKMKISPNGDGTYTYLLDINIKIIPTANCSPVPIVSGPDYLPKYSEGIATATAGSHFIKAQISARVTIHGTCNLNFDALYLEFSSQGFSLGGLSGGPVGCGVSQKPEVQIQRSSHLL